MRKTFEERFWEKVDKKGPDDCWLWQASVRGGGYGQIGEGGGSKVIKDAHRASWEIENGPIKNRLFVLHKCDVRACVNPNHLFLGTQKDNMDDMNAKGRRVTKSSPGSTNGSAKLSEEAVKKIVERYALGDISCVNLGLLFNVGSTTIHRIVTRKSWGHLNKRAANKTGKVAKGRRVNHQPGSSNPAAKLTEDSVREIRKRYALGKVTYPELGMFYGVSGSTIHEAVSRRTWKHVA